VSRAAAIKHGYTTGARGLASRSVVGLTRTRVTPNALTASGVALCAAASILVLFEGRNELLFYWLAAAVFVAGSLLDILDGALARAGGKTTPFGAFLDSTTDRVSEGFMLTAIAYVLATQHRPVFVAVAMAGVCSMCETVATITQSICSGSIPDRSSAIRDEATDIICTVSSGVAKRRCLMPERCWIHSSVESMASTMSALGTIRDGR